MNWDWKAIGGLGVALGGGVTWGLSQLKTILEIQKLRRESRNERPPAAIAAFAGDAGAADLNELPPLPNPCIQNEFSVIPSRFWVDLRQPVPMLYIGIWGINYGKSDLIIHTLAATHFYLSTVGKSVEIRSSIVDVRKRLLGRQGQQQHFIEATLEAYKEQFAALPIETEYSASISVEMHGRRGSVPVEYACSDLSIVGSINRPVVGLVSNLELGLIAAYMGNGTELHRLIQAGDNGRLADLRDKAMTAFPGGGQSLGKGF